MTRSALSVQVRQKPWNAVDAAALVGFCAASVALSAAAIVRRPDLVMGADFLFQDVGHNLLVADRLLSGQSLYRDVFYPYGPISAYIYTATAFLFGNTPTTYLALLAAISGVNACLAFILVRRAAGLTTAILVGIGLLALLPIPGAIAGGFTVSPHLVLERTLLLVVALCWAPIGRTRRSSVLLGATLGVWQGVKFGGALPAGAAIVLLDTLSVLALGLSQSRLRAMVGSWLWILAAFVAIELGWVFLAFRTGPPALALDIMFPLYIFRAYSVVTPDIRWPLWAGWRLAVGQYLLPLSAGAVAVVGFFSWLRSLRRGTHAESDGQATGGGIFVPLLFFAISTFTYFRHVYHFQQFLWALVPAAAWQLHRVASMARMAALLAWAPGLLMVLRSACLTLPPKAMVHVSLPTGGSIMVDPLMATRIAFLRKLASEEADGAAVLYVPIGSGWQFAFRVPSTTRHTWFFAPQVVRPFEEDDFLRSLDQARALVTCDVPGTPEKPLPVFFPLPPEIAAEAYRHVEPWMVGAGCRVFRIRRPPS
jgi:hypothetical protein